MSMDLVVWTACTLSFPIDLPDGDKWKNYGDSDWAYETEAWQVVVDKDPKYSPSQKVLEINAKYNVATLLTLEPIGADEKGYEYLDHVVSMVVRKCGGGIVEDPTGLSLLGADGNEIK